MKFTYIIRTILIVGIIAHCEVVHGENVVLPGDKYACAYLGGRFTAEYSLPMYALYTDCHTGEQKEVALEDLNTNNAAVTTHVDIHTISRINAITSEADMKIQEGSNIFDCYGLVGASSCKRR